MPIPAAFVLSQPYHVQRDSVQSHNEAPTGILNDSRGTTVEVNPQAAGLFGRGVEQRKGKPASDRTTAPALTETILHALADANHVNPNNCYAHVNLSVPSEIRTTAEAREVVRDWILMLSELASSKDATLGFSAIHRKNYIELQLRLIEFDPELEIAEPDRVNEIPDVAAGGLFEMGGEFRVSSSYPETSVWLKLQAA